MVDKKDIGSYRLAALRGIIHGSRRREPRINAIILRRARARNRGGRRCNKVQFAIVWLVRRLKIVVEGYAASRATCNTS